MSSFVDPRLCGYRFRKLSHYPIFECYPKGQDSRRYHRETEDSAKTPAKKIARRGERLKSEIVELRNLSFRCVVLQHFQRFIQLVIGLVLELVFFLVAGLFAGSCLLVFVG